jgi:hypothetical protein
LVNTDAVHLCIRSMCRSKLKLQPIEEKEVTLASGSRKLVPYVRPVEIKNRAGFVVRW